jgi:hypothetical protein
MQILGVLHARVMLQVPSAASASGVREGDW